MCLFVAYARHQPDPAEADKFLKVAKSCIVAGVVLGIVLQVIWTILRSTEFRNDRSFQFQPLFG